jgi:hypothetical protein
MRSWQRASSRRPTAGLCRRRRRAPRVAHTDCALDENRLTSRSPRAAQGPFPDRRGEEDKAMRDRTRNDTYLRRAKVCVGLMALG